MSRPLKVVDSADPAAVFRALRAALSGVGPAILPHPGRPEGLPETVEQRVAVVVETSGSTGRPKRVALGADSLLASAAASDVTLGGPGQWLMALPAHYIAGVNVLVRSLASQTEPITIDANGTRFVAAANELDAALRFVSLVPTQLQRLIEQDDALDALRRFDRILVGGQATPAPLLARAAELGLTVTRTYGSSETSGGCVWDGEPIGDTGVRVVDGRVELSGSMLAHGYLGDPERTESAFHELDGRRWYRTDDTGTFADGILRISGRADDMIISGGVKISLGEVEQAVRALPGLGDAVVVATEHAQWGQSSVVVTTRPAELLQLRDAVAAVLGRAAAPTGVVVVDAIPLLSSGKPDRAAAARLAGG
ncbi:O-succinylbenzoic acid--CoA ligase [Salinibacterium sp. CAN_S4]|uniref:AMP-binding protein n=1 Tax=Salinibacterium sp. CAN_S4 TaxID=2787727 RepID=UPI0018F0316B